MMQKIYILLSLLCFTFMGIAQQVDYHPYFPQKIRDDEWKFATHAYYNNHNNSNSLTNEFSLSLNNSEFISDEMKDKQINLLDGPVLVGRNSSAGFGAWINNKQNHFFYYVGLDAQQVLDGQVNPNLVGLVFYGNKPYAGKKLDVSNTEYYNIYFNRIKAGLGKSFGNNSLQQTISGVIAFTVGQNLDYINLQNGSVFTQIDGDYLEMDIAAETQRGNTAWGDMFTINGMGVSADLNYSLLKENDFFVSLGISNLGFISWNKDTFTANVDASYYFEGVENDTNSNNQIPDNFSVENLRDIVFTHPSHSSFNESLPFDIKLSAGKFIADGKFYIGMNTTFYPTLISNYRAEIFATWNLKNHFQVSPIIGYSSFKKMNIGLALSAQIAKSLYLRAGSSYLNSMFISNSPVGQGGFVSLVWVR